MSDIETRAIGTQQQSYMVALFVGELPDGTLKYDITLVDRVHGVELPMRVCVFQGEPISCESHHSREQTSKVPAIRPVSMVHLQAYPPIRTVKEN